MSGLPRSRNNSGTLGVMAYMASNDDILKMLLRLTATVDATAAHVVTIKNELRDQRDTLDKLCERVDSIERTLIAHIDNPFAHGELVRSTYVTRVTTTR